MPIEDFQIGKQLGKGAFSSVCVVKRIQDNKTYAMKRVKMGQLSYKDKQNALNEIRILASLNHPNIIGYKEAFFDDTTQTLNIVMEYADDGDIQSKIKINQRKRLLFSESTIWNFLLQILHGLNYLHENKIMHRDLKSANIFLSKNGTVKIGDLNVSKVTQLGLASTHTGTPYYASPEVWKDHPYDYKCDIWSVGVILYELCTLKVPFRGTNLKTLVKNINLGKYESISKTYSNDLNNILSKMLVVNPNKRLSAKELLSLDFVQEKNEGFLQMTKQGKAFLMKTIKMPLNLRDINRVIPKKRYYDREMMKENDEYEIMKESIREGGFGNFNFKDLISDNNNNNNNNNNNYGNDFQGKKPIIVKRKNAIDDLYDKIFKRNNNNINFGNNFGNNNINNNRFDLYNNNYQFGNYNLNNRNNNNNHLINNYNRNLNFDYNRNIYNRKEIEDNNQNKELNLKPNENQNKEIKIEKEITNKEIKNEKLDNKEAKKEQLIGNQNKEIENQIKEQKNQNMNYNPNRFDYHRNNYNLDHIKNQPNEDKIKKENEENINNLDKQILELRNEFENLRNQLNHRKKNKDNNNQNNQLNNHRNNNLNNNNEHQNKINNYLNNNNNSNDYINKINEHINENNNNYQNKYNYLNNINNDNQNKYDYFKNNYNDYQNKINNYLNNNNQNYQNKYNFLNNNNQNKYNNNQIHNFRNENESERRRQIILDKINKIKMNYNRNHNNSNKKYEQLFERNSKDNNNKFIVHRYYKNDNNNNNKNDYLENDFKYPEFKYKYVYNNNQINKEINNNIPIYNKINYNNYNLYSNQDRIKQRPISANINYYHLNKGDEVLNQFKEKYNIKSRDGNMRNRSPLFGRQNYNERKIEYEKVNFNDYLRNNNRVNNININNNYYINNQNNDKSPFKYQNHILKKPYDYNNNNNNYNYFNNNNY